VLYLIIWLGASAPEPFTDVVTIRGKRVETVSYQRCSSSSPVWPILPIIVDGLIVATTLLYSLRTSHVRLLFNEGVHIRHALFVSATRPLACSGRASHAR
jgi:hypothetical protein